MSKVQVYNPEGKVVDEMELSDNIFAVAMNDALLHQAVVAQMSNERQVLAHTKTKSEVRGGGRKPHRQKGTGRARAGSTRSPIWKGGGVTFGPRKDRNFKKDLNAKMKRKALFMALSDRLAMNNLLVLNELNIPEFSTKKFNEIIKNLEAKVTVKPVSGEKKKADKDSKDSPKISKRSFLVINDNNTLETKYSGNNLKGVNLINLDNINLLDVLKYKNLILTVSAVKTIEERYKS